MYLYLKREYAFTIWPGNLILCIDSKWMKTCFCKDLHLNISKQLYLVKNRKWLRFHQPLKNETNYKILFNNKNEPSGHHTTTWMSLKSMLNDRNQVSTWNARKGRTIALGNKPESARGWKSGWTDYEAAHGQCCRWNCSVPW